MNVYIVFGQAYDDMDVDSVYSTEKEAHAYAEYLNAKDGWLVYRVIKKEVQ